MNKTLSPEEQLRYARHLVIPGFGEAAQLRLKQARVLVVGSGGLGSPLLMYLAVAGVGHIGIVDDDRIDLTNLQRQVLFTTKEIGQYKAEVARNRILAMNPHIEVEVFSERLTSENAARLLSDYDIVADGTDNFPTRYLVNDACVLFGKTNVFGAIFRFDGQVAVFNHLKADGSRSPNYRDLFPEPPPPGLVPNCAEGGVLGVLPGIIGSMQANEIIKIITGVGEPLVGKVLLFDARDLSSRILNIKKRNDTAIEELIDYELFCGIKPTAEVKDITATEFKQLQAANADFLLIDVREPAEYHRFNIGGQLIPLGEIEAHIDSLPADRLIVVHCQSGRRSKEAIARMLAKRQMENVVNLRDGLLDFGLGSS